MWYDSDRRTILMKVKQKSITVFLTDTKIKPDININLGLPVTMPVTPSCHKRLPFAYSVVVVFYIHCYNFFYSHLGIEGLNKT